MGQKGTGLLRLDDQRVVVHGPDAHGVDIIGLPLVVCLGALDVVVEEGVDVPRVGMEEPLEGEFEIVGRHGPAVAPPRVPAQVKGPRLPIFGGFPRVRGARHKLAVHAEHGEPFEVEFATTRHVNRDALIHALGFGGHVPEHLIFQRRGVLGKTVHQRGVGRLFHLRGLVEEQLGSAFVGLVRFGLRAALQEGQRQYGRDENRRVATKMVHHKNIPYAPGGSIPRRVNCSGMASQAARCPAIRSVKCASSSESTIGCR